MDVDLDHDLSEPQRKVLWNNVEMFLKEWVVETFPNNSISWSICDSSRKNKASRHYVMSMFNHQDEVLFEGTGALRQLYKTMEPLLRKYWPNGRTNTIDTCPIDPAVYGQNRLLRMIYSVKHGKRAGWKLPVEQNGTPIQASLLRPRNEPEIYKYFVCAELSGPHRIVPYVAANVPLPIVPQRAAAAPAAYTGGNVVPSVQSRDKVNVLGAVIDLAIDNNHIQDISYDKHLVLVHALRDYGFSHAETSRLYSRIASLQPHHNWGVLSANGGCPYNAVISRSYAVPINNWGQGSVRRIFHILLQQGEGRDAGVLKTEYENLFTRLMSS